MEREEMKMSQLKIRNILQACFAAEGVASQTN